jgi:hypothetical protein
MMTDDAASENVDFLEIRRKVKDSELLSASVEKLLWQVRFSGRLSVVVQNGRVLRSGYEEGLFRRRMSRE